MLDLFNAYALWGGSDLRKRTKFGAFLAECGPELPRQRVAIVIDDGVWRRCRQPSALPNGLPPSPTRPVTVYYPKKSGSTPRMPSLLFSPDPTPAALLMYFLVS